MKTIQNNLLILSAIIVLFSACKKFLDIDPPKDQITPIQAFENDKVATSTVTQIYSRMIATGTNGFASGGLRSVSYLTSLSADDLTEMTPGEFYNNQLQSSNGTISGFLWNQPYQFIYTANAILESLNTSNGVTEAARKQIQGESRFIRAFCYFYLTNLFGDVPLLTTTDYRKNANASRAPISEVYQQITTDLLIAESQLSNEYITGQRIRPNKSTATAMLARVYLYTGDFENAIKQSSKVIGNKSLYDTVNLNSVFLKNSKEAIWQLMPVTPGINTSEGSIFIANTTPLNAVISQSLYDSFETLDKRKTNWIGTVNSPKGVFHFPYKYKIASGNELNEYSMVLRLAEQYLIRAEALAMLNDIPGAIADLNVLRKRAGLIGLELNLNQSDCLKAVEQARRTELFSEWGHRWLDLKRTAQADAVLKPQKGINWQNTDLLFPIPQVDIERNKNLTQNKGYQ